MKTYQLQSSVSTTDMTWQNDGKPNTLEIIHRDFNQMQWIEPHFGYRILEMEDDKIVRIGKSNYPEITWEEV